MAAEEASGWNDAVRFPQFPAVTVKNCGLLWANDLICGTSVCNRGLSLFFSTVS
jgi:hypothetical protein